MKLDLFIVLIFNEYDGYKGAGYRGSKSRRNMVVFS